MQKAITLINAERKEIGVMRIDAGGEISISIDILPEYLYMKENVKSLGKMIFSQDTLPLKYVQKNEEQVLILQKQIPKDDPQYLQAAVAYINSCKMIAPRIFAVLK